MFTNRALWRTAGAMLLALAIALVGLGPSLIIAIMER